MTTYNASGYAYDSALLTYDGGLAGSTSFPIAGVFVAFTDGPYVANPSWTEITPYVRSISTSRGRTDDLEDFPAGTAQLVLDNRDRRFDPFYTTGPYYQQLIPRRQIRIVGQANGVNYEVFRGFVAGWPVEWIEAGFDSTVTIQCFDALGLMANEVVTTDWAGTYTRSLNPVHYWRADEAQPVSTIKDEIGGWNVVPFGAQPIKAFETPALGNGLLSGSLFTVDWSFTGPSPENYGTVTFATWMQLSTYQADVPGFPGNFYTSTMFFQDGNVQIVVRRGGTTATLSQVLIYVDVYRGGTRYTRQMLFSPPFGSIDDPFHVAVVGTDTGASAPNMTVYLNGEAQSFATTTSSGTAFFSNFSGFQSQYAAFQEAASWRRGLSATEIRGLYEFGVGRIQETSSARMARLRETTDFPASLTSFTSSPVATVTEIGSGAGVIQEMQLTKDSEGGEMYVSKAGVLTMTPRFGNFAGRSATSQATFTDSGAGLRYGPELLIEYDADSLKNDITVQISGDGEANVYNDANITEYGGAATTIETYLPDIAAGTALATAKSGVYGTLVPRISPIDVSVNTTQADWQTILGLELLDRVTFKRTPTVGNQFDRDALIQGIDHQIEPGVWRTQLTLSMRYTSPLIVGDSVRGRVDFNYCG